MGEFSVENIIFYEEVQKFKNMREKSLLIVKAHDISDIYIKEGASSQINVSDRIRNIVLRKIENQQFSDDMFDLALAEITALMYSNSFYRFTQTAPYKVYFAKKNVEREILRELTE